MLGLSRICQTQLNIGYLVSNSNIKGKAQSPIFCMGNGNQYCNLLVVGTNVLYKHSLTILGRLVRLQSFISEGGEGVCSLVTKVRDASIVFL